MGIRPSGTLAWRINGSLEADVRRSPLMGEHNNYVLGDLLDIPESEIKELIEIGVLA